MNNKKSKISHAFQRWLLVLVAVALLATTGFLWVIETRLAEQNAVRLLELNISVNFKIGIFSIKIWNNFVHPFSK